MPFLLMGFLTLACLPEPWQWDAFEPPPCPFPMPRELWSLILTALVLCLPLLQAFFVSQRVVRPLRRDPHLRDDVLHHYERNRFIHQLLLFGAYALAMGLGGWGWTVNQLWHPEYAGSLAEPHPVWPLAEIIVLLPFLIGMVLSWVIFYDAENALHRAAQRLIDGDPLEAAFASPEEREFRQLNRSPDRNYFGGRWSYVQFQARQKLALVCIPIIVLLGQKELARQLGGLTGWRTALLEVVGFALILIVFLVMPLVVRLVLGLKPLPPGPIRDRLEQTARRLKFRCSDILVWNTRKGMANAMVVGILPWPRYVIFTDRLLHDFTPDEIEAVFGHEVGHVKHFHMPYYFLFLSLSLFVLGLLTLALLGFLSSLGVPYVAIDPGHDEILHMVPMGALVMAYIFVVFGFISRRCERQADIYGCRAVSCGHRDCQEHDDAVALAPGGKGLCPTGIRIFIRALEKVADVNGISRDRPGLLQSWQHSTIALRVAFLQQMIADPSIEPVFQRRVAFVKWGLFVVLGGLLAAVLIPGIFLN